MYTLVIRSLPKPSEAVKSAGPSRGGVTGAGVAEWELVGQLSAHSSAESLVVLVPRLTDAVEATLAVLPHRERVRAVPYDRLHELRALDDVVVFSADSRLTEATHVRAVCGRPEWIVSGVTHALSFTSGMQEVVLLHLHGMQPYDSLICTSTAGGTAVRHLIDAAERYLAGRFGHAAGCPMQLPLIPLPAPRFEWPLVSRRAAREALGLPLDAVVFMYFGRFSDHLKADLRPLLIAFARVSARIHDVVFVLAGSNQEGQAASLDAVCGALGIEDRVYIRTDPTTSMKALLYSAADVFVSLSDSLQETFGLTLLEAMTAGLPVIASDWSGYRDIVQPDETGFLIPTHWADCVSSLGPMAPLTGDASSHRHAAQSVVVDLPAAVEAMERLARDPDLRRRMGESGRAVVRRDFSGEAIVRRYEDVWDESRAASRLIRHPCRGPDVVRFG